MLRLIQKTAGRFIALIPQGVGHGELRTLNFQKILFHDLFHSMAGSELFFATSGISASQDYMAFRTYGYRLPAKYIIHLFTSTQIPQVGGDEATASDVFCSCRIAMDLANRSKVTRIAFPCMGSGQSRDDVLLPIFLEEAVNGVTEALRAGSSVKEVVFCCASKREMACFQKALADPKVWPFATPVRWVP